MTRLAVPETSAAPDGPAADEILSDGGATSPAVPADSSLFPELELDEQEALRLKGGNKKEIPKFEIIVTLTF